MQKAQGSWPHTFTREPDSQPISQGSRPYLTNKMQTESKFIYCVMFSAENFSTGCKHTVRFWESEGFFSQGTIRNLALLGSRISLSPHRALVERGMNSCYLESHIQMCYSLLTKGSYFSYRFLSHLSRS